MLKEEFEKLSGKEVTFEVYEVINAMYMSNDMEKQEFVKKFMDMVRIMGNRKTRVKWFHQTENKQVRIFTHSGDAQNMLFFPQGWERMWPQFYTAMTGYMKTGRNEHDDAPDGLMGYAEGRAESVKKDRQHIKEEIEHEIEILKSHFRVELAEEKHKHNDFVKSIVINSHKLDKAFVDGECLRELGALEYYKTMRDAGCEPTANDLDMFIKELEDKDSF